MKTKASKIIENIFLRNTVISIIFSPLVSCFIRLLLTILGK